MPKPSVWHISADFPDSIEPDKTPVIRALLELTSEPFDHFTISLNRLSPGVIEAGKLAIGGGETLSIARVQEFSGGMAIAYRAPSKGLLHKTMLRRLAEALAKLLQNHPPPDLIIGHKLTVEGIVAEALAKKLGVPYAVSIQGDTDTKIMAVRRDLAPAFRRIFHGAQVAFPFTPWALRDVEMALGKRAGHSMLLPCPSDLDEPLPPQPLGNGFVTAFHLKNYKRKNLPGLVDAMTILKRSADCPPLEVIGGGSEAQLASCKALSAKCGSISFAGPLDRTAIRGRFNRATGFVLPSLRESFGLVFVEALFAGLPIIYPRGQALHGYVDDLPFALAVDARSPQAIADAMRHVADNEAGLKSDLAKWQVSEHAKQFQRPAIAAQFAEGLLAAANSA